MDPSKLDAPLVAALEDAAGQEPDGAMREGARIGSPALSVFVHLNPGLSKREKEKLAQLGLPVTWVSSAQGGIATATLSPEQVRELSEHPSVRQLRLSSPLRLLGDE